MTTVASTRLVLEEGEDSRAVFLHLRADRGLDLSAQDLGPAVRRMWGEDEYEFGIRIDAADVPRLAYALLAEHYRDDPQAVNKVRELARRHGIDPHVWNWA